MRGPPCRGGCWCLHPQPGPPSGNTRRRTQSSSSSDLINILTVWYNTGLTHLASSCVSQSSSAGTRSSWSSHWGSSWTWGRSQNTSHWPCTSQRISNRGNFRISCQSLDVSPEKEQFWLEGREAVGLTLGLFDPSLWSMINQLDNYYFPGGGQYTYRWWSIVLTPTFPHITHIV